MAGLVVSYLGLVACGSADDTDPTPTGTPTETTAATPITGEGFTFDAPEGWKQGANDGAEVPGSEVRAFAVDDEDVDGFADNISVVVDPRLVQVGTIDDIPPLLLDSLEQEAEDVTLNNRVSLDRENAVVVTANYVRDDVPFVVTQIVTLHDQTGWVISIGLSGDTPPAEQAEIAQLVAASWKWDS